MKRDQVSQLIRSFYRHPDYIHQWRVYSDPSLESETLEDLVDNFGSVFHEKNGENRRSADTTARLAGSAYTSQAMPHRQPALLRQIDILTG